MLLLLSFVALAIWVGLFFFGEYQSRTHAQALRNYVANHFAVIQDIHIRFGDLGLRFPDLVNATQAQMDYRLKLDKIPFVYRLIDELPSKIKRPRNENFEPAEVVITPTETATEEALTATISTQDINLTTSEITSKMTSETASETNNETNSETNSETTSETLIETTSEPKQRSIPEYVVELAYTEELSIWIDINDLKATLTYNLESCHLNDLPFYLTQAIYDNLLLVDLTQHRESTYGDFKEYIPELKVNFIAAEELGSTPEDLSLRLKARIEDFTKLVSPYVKTTVDVLNFDVTKKRIPSIYLTNTTSTLNIFYLTSLEGITNKIQDVSLYHINKEVPDDYVEKDQYGTAYIEQLKRAETLGYNCSAFLDESSEAIARAVKLPQVDINNVNLRVESSMKHNTISGIVAVLDQILEAKVFDSQKFKNVTTLVDTILAESNHDWSSHLQRVYKLYVS